MTTQVVADASAVLAWIVESQATQAADVFLAEASEIDFIAPYIMQWEVRNVLASLRRRQRIGGQAYADALTMLDRLEIDVAEPHDQAALVELSEVAFATGLSLFDASYLQLAAQYSCGLATRDAALVAAARRASIDCFDLKDVPDPMTDQPEVLTRVEAGVGRITLNRPKALHALTTNMCRLIIDALLAWREDEAVQVVLLDHSGERGFCAGGDIRMLAESGAGDGAEARAFFHTEYRLNHLLFTYPKCVIAVMDGITMGGGVGLSMPAAVRIATERTTFAMPETGIGLFPDVGGGWFLPRLPGKSGLWLALTGARIKGADCVRLGIATHYMPSEHVEGFKAALGEHPDAVAGALAHFVRDAGPAPLEPHLADIDLFFGRPSVEAILEGLEQDTGEWARSTLVTLGTKSPQTLKVAFRQLAHGALFDDFADNMAMEYRIGARVVQRADFLEGVRAVIVDKDNSPRWNPETVEGVGDDMLDEIFAPLPADHEWTPLA